MAENRGFYNVYDSSDRLEPADRLKIEHSIYISDENTDISKLTPLSVDRLQTMRGESAAAEQVIFDKLRRATAEWEAQAAQTRLLDKAIEYVKMPPVKHTSNQWKKSDVNNDRQNMSNMVYAMSYYVYERTRYDKAAEKSVPVAWELSWSVHTNAPSNLTRQRIAGQDKKTYTNKADMEKYLNGRIKAYSHLFTEISPPIPKEYADNFRVNGKLLPGYTVEDEELEQPDRAADVSVGGVPILEENNDLRKEHENMNEPLNIQLLTREMYEKGDTDGAWLKLPATAEQLQAALARIGAQGGELGTDYFINGFETPVAAISRLSLENAQKAEIDELNYLAAALQSRDDRQIDKLNAASEMIADRDNIYLLVELTQNTGVYDFHPGIFNNIQLGEHTLEHSGMIQIPDEWAAAIDIEMLGQLAAASEKGIFTEYGYIVSNGEEWKPVDEIPQEYRISPESEKEYDAIATRQPAVTTAQPTEQVQPVIPLVLQSEKPVEKLKEITDRLEQGITDIFNSEQYKSYLKTMSKFYNYSFNNTMLIFMQKPDASLIAGYGAWQSNFERQVQKGEKGIKIIAPSPFKVKKEMEKIDPNTQRPVIGRDGKPVTEEVDVKIPAYKVVSVFDVSQTDGKELPAIGVDELTGSVEQYKDFFAALEKASPVPVAFEKIDNGANGYYHLEDKRIALQEGMSELQTLKTAIHEIAHARLHDIDVNAPKDEQPRAQKRTREVEAESIAYTVCQHYGLDTSDYSFGYVAGWSSGKELTELKASLETIRGTAAGLITEIDGHFSELQKDKTQEQTAEQEQGDIFSIYQLKRGDDTRDYRFEPFDRLQVAGLAVDPANYELVYTAPITADTNNLEKIFEKFNIDHPGDFKGHSLSVSDIVTLNCNGKETAHYVDSFGYKQVPEFLNPATGQKPFDLRHTTDCLQKVHDSVMSADPKKTMGTAAYNMAIKRLDKLSGEIPDNQPQLKALVDHAAASTDLSMLKERMATVHSDFIKPANYLETAEKSTEQNYNMIDGVMNNTPTVAELEAKANAGERISLTDLATAIKAEKTAPVRDMGEKQSIRKQLKADKERIAAAPKKTAAKSKNADLEV